MSAAHTPGPWLIEAETCHTGDIATVHHTADKWVTIYAPHWAETGMDEHEQSANARLIAAAPDLLEALKLYVLQDNFATDYGYGVGGEAKATAEAAIAKATGGAA